MADISKITPPGSQTTYNLKDATAREQANWNTNNGVKNLLDSKAVTTVKNGVTFTVNADKSIAISGTNSVNDTTNLPITNGYVSNVWAGKKLSGCTNGSNTTYALACMYSNDGVSYIKTAYQIDGDYTIENFNYIYIIVTVYNNYAITGTQTIYPMIRDIGDSTYEPYALPNTKITPELIELVDSGAKNLLTEYSATSVNNYKDISINLSAGTYVISFATLSTTAETSKVLVAFYLTPNLVTGVQVDVGNNTSAVITIPSSADVMRVYAVGTAQTSNNNSVTFTNAMLCSKAAWDVSQKYVPYRPTYEETVEQVAENENNISMITPTVYVTGDVSSITVTGIMENTNPSCLFMCADRRSSSAEDIVFMVTRYGTTARLMQIAGAYTPTISISGDIITVSGLKNYQQITALSANKVTITS